MNMQCLNQKYIIKFVINEDAAFPFKISLNLFY